MEGLRDWFTNRAGWAVVLALAALGVLLWVMRRWRVRRQQRLRDYPDYVHPLLNLLGAQGAAANPATTLRELAQALLQERQHLSSYQQWRDVLLRIVDTYYAERYGGQVIAIEVKQGLRQELIALR